jgi:NADPH:quinone reductase-like Zn-dependent oxidoreductase
VWTKYGSADGLQLQEVETPVPKDNEVLIRVRASTVTAADCELRSFRASGVFWLPLRFYIGLTRPTRIRILGQELAGDIVATGRSVTRYQSGEAVSAWTGLRLGGHAEYACLSENTTMAVKPSNISYAEAAAVPLGGLEAWQYLNGNIQAGGQVLIIGAGGSIGTFAVQLAKHFGAEVTAVDRAEKLDMLRSIGADHVIDFTQDDFTRAGRLYDVIFDAPGKSSFSRCRRALKPTGQYLTANPGTAQQLRMMWNVFLRPRRAAPEQSRRGRDDLVSLMKLIEAGRIRSVIDRRYPLEQAAEAHRYVESGLKQGNVVIQVAPEGQA